MSDMGDIFFGGMIAGGIAGATLMWAWIRVREISPYRRSRKERLELPEDRVYPPRGRR